MFLREISKVAPLIISLAACIGLYQIIIIKRDTASRRERASLENSILVIDRYVDKFIKIADEIDLRTIEKGIPNLVGSYEDLPKYTNEILIKRAKIVIEMGFHRYINELNTVAASVICGLCNDQFVYRSIGKSYCQCVARYYDLICELEASFHPESCILELFELWRKRLMARKIEKDLRKLTDSQKELQDIINRLGGKDISVV
jgi:hypothetical protein